MEQEKSITQMYTSEIVTMLGRRFKDYRIGCDMTQKEVSQQSGISVVTIRKFENGNLYNITLGTFIELLRAIGFMQGLDDVLPELPVSPYELEKIQQGKRKRVRHAK
jgi:transcriptional regulator with XRE-family HTH domain